MHNSPAGEIGRRRPEPLCYNLAAISFLPLRRVSACQEDGHEIAVLDVTTDVSGVEEQCPNQGQGSDSTAEVDIGDDNYQRLIEEENVSALYSASGSTCAVWSVPIGSPVHSPLLQDRALHQAKEVASLAHPSTSSTPLWEQE